MKCRAQFLWEWEEACKCGHINFDRTLILEKYGYPLIDIVLTSASVPFGNLCTRGQDYFLEDHRPDLFVYDTNYCSGSGESVFDVKGKRWLYDTSRQVALGQVIHYLERHFRYHSHRKTAYALITDVNVWIIVKATRSSVDLPFGTAPGAGDTLELAEAILFSQNHPFPGRVPEFFTTLVAIFATYHNSEPPPAILSLRRYKLTRPIYGGHSVVWNAQCGDEKFVLKFLDPEKADREISAMKLLEGVPRVIRFADSFPIYFSGAYFFQALLLHPVGTSCNKLRIHLIEENFFRESLVILQEVHARGVVHGDVKLSNFILVDGKDVHLIDFSCARFALELPVSFLTHQRQDLQKLIYAIFLRKPALSIS